MKIAIIFISFLQITSTEILNCDYNYGPFYSIIGRVYQCKVHDIKIVSASVTIDGISNAYEVPELNDGIKMIWIWGSIFHYIPNGIGNHFKNIEAIWIHYCGLKEMTHRNLKQFPKLLYLYAGFNQLKVLDRETFESNPRLEWINLKNNKLKFISYMLFEKLHNVSYMNFENNQCISALAHSRTHIAELKNSIEENCHFSDEIFCNYYTMNHQGRILYTCSGSNIAFDDHSIEIKSMIGHHQNEHNNNSDVKAIFVRNQLFHYFPLNFVNFFHDLEVIQIIRSKLKQLNRDDIKHYKNLKILWLPHNQIERLSAEIFADLLKLERLSFYGNNLKIIASDVLNNLRFLRIANFVNNQCITFEAQSSGTLKFLKMKIKVYCNESAMH